MRPSSILTDASTRNSADPDRLLDLDLNPAECLPETINGHHRLLNRFLPDWLRAIWGRRGGWLRDQGGAPTPHDAHASTRPGFVEDRLRGVGRQPDATSGGWITRKKSGMHAELAVVQAHPKRHLHVVEVGDLAAADSLGHDEGSSRRVFAGASRGDRRLQSDDSVDEEECFLATDIDDQFGVSRIRTLHDLRNAVGNDAVGGGRIFLCRLFQVRLAFAAGGVTFARYGRIEPWFWAEEETAPGWGGIERNVDVLFVDGGGAREYSGRPNDDQGGCGNRRGCSAHVDKT